MARYFNRYPANYILSHFRLKIMKNAIRSGLLAGLLLMAATSLDAQIIVNVMPSRPTVVVTKPPIPGPGYIWIDEDWAPQGKKYKWKGGYWSAPPRKGAAYNKGYWKQNKKGWHWVPGKWK
jgi:hypothetical protein